MKQAYRDIIEKLGEPLWWDEVGCPRYQPFKPDLANNIYAQQVALCRIACQNCGVQFNVCLTNHNYLDGDLKGDLRDGIRHHTLHYGDPPNSGCCPSGATMNSDMIKVLEFWVRVKFDWKREKKFEKVIDEE